MKTWQALTLTSLLFLSACGDNSPFDEDYWDDPSSIGSRNSEETTNNQNYTANLASLSSANLGDVTGTAQVEITETDVNSTITLADLPQTLMVGQRSISTRPCTEIAAQFPPPVVVGSTTEFKSINEVDNGSREALIAELNQDNPQNGDSINLEGKSFVVKAFVQTINSPAPVTASLVPIACGTLVASSAQGQDDNDDDSDGTVIGGMGTGGTIGETTGTTGTTGMTTGMTTGSTGTVGGTISGTIGGTTGGSIGGTIGTTAGTTGTVGTTTGGVTGDVGGTISGTIGGTTVGGTTGF